MNITFITKEKDQLIINDYEEKGLKVSNTLEPVIQFLENGIKHYKKKVHPNLYDNLSLFPIGIDTEFSHLNVHRAKFLLMSIGNSQNQFVLDMRYFSPNFLDNFNEDILWVCQNAQIEERICTVGGEFSGFKYIYDTLLVEQRLRMGLTGGNSLNEIVKRRLGVYYQSDKEEIRSSFTKPITNFSYSQIYYSAEDIIYLEDIMNVQLDGINKFNLSKVIFNIEFPLIKILAKANIDGIYLNKEKWNEILTKNKEKLFKITKELDAELKKLSDNYPEFDALSKNYNPTKSKRAKSLTRKRNTYEITQTDLFGNNVYSLSQNEGNINYSSSSQVLNIFKIFEEPLPYKEERDRFGQIEIKYTTGTPELGLYLEQNPTTKLFNFIKILIEYKETAKEIDSFGERFFVEVLKKPDKKPKIGYLNTKTQKVHTIYRQCVTSTGRLASGQADIGYFNSQQIPKSLDFRHSFGLSPKEIDDGYYITTLDLVSAEVIIMCALAQDDILYEYGVKKDDVHSPIATEAWRQIYNYRKSVGRSLKVTDSAKNNYMLTPNFIVTKEINKGLRQDFKNFSFGCFYGMAATKGAKTLSISIKESEIVIDTMKKMFPKTFDFLDSKSLEATTKGYVIHNNVTNSRRWFPKIIESKENKKEPSFSDYISAYNEARNSPIQGTQADMIKESMVNIYNFALKEKLDLQILFQVHDELVIKHKNKDLGKEIANIMAETCTKYLNGFAKMAIDYKTLHTWTK